MTAETLPGLSRPTGLIEDLTHYFCQCDPEVGICGADLTGLDELGDDEGGPDCELCSVLLDASGGLCGRCGQ